MIVLDQIKSHPKLAAAAALGTVAVIVLLRMTSGASTMETVGVPGSDVGAGDTLYAAMAQVQADIAGKQIQAGVQSENIAAGLEIGKLQAALQTDALKSNENIQLATINATLQALTNHDTLAANVDINNANQQTQQMSIATTGQVEMQRTLANALVSSSQTQANVAIASINASKKDCGFLGAIFGC